MPPDRKGCHWSEEAKQRGRTGQASRRARESLERELSIRLHCYGPYFDIYVHGHYVPLHIYSWELINGPVPVDEKGHKYHVHHTPVDEGGMGVRCNCIANLKCLSSSEHVASHANRRSKETNDKISSTLMGHRHSEETRARLREAWKRRKAHD